MNLIDDYSLTTGFFGKLPKFADFVKLNASSSEIAVLDQWLQEGLSIAKIKYKSEWRNYYQNTNTINFIYPFTGTDKIILGTICPSNDKSGRSFPFILFGNLKKEILNQLSIQKTILEFDGLLKYFESTFNANYQNENLNDLKSLVSGFSTATLKRNSVENSYREYISENSVENLFNSEMQDPNNDGNISLNNLINKNISYLENAPGIRFSFEVGKNNEPMKLSFITELLLKYYQKNFQIPSLFWSRKAENYMILYIFFQKPTPSNFLDLINSESTVNQNVPQRIENIFKESANVNKNTSLKELLLAIKTNTI